MQDEGQESEGEGDGRREGKVISRLPVGLAVVPLGLAVWSLDLLGSEFFGVPEGFAV